MIACDSVSWGSINFFHPFSFVPGGKRGNLPPEYQKISEQWLAAENELTAYRDRCMKEGTKLFTRYFWDLWD